jgi:hypothetical protein
MKRIAIRMCAILMLASGCAARLQPVATSVPTPSAVAAPTIAATALPPTPSSPELRAYLRRVHASVLVAFNQGLEDNRRLLATASSQGLEADVLCSGEEGYWLHFDDLWLGLSVVSAPPDAQAFHQALLDTLAVANKSAATQDWFCQTYRALGQPAEGLWARLAAETRTCVRRRNELRDLWRVLGGAALGLAW